MKKNMGTIDRLLRFFVLGPLSLWGALVAGPVTSDAERTPPTEMNPDLTGPRSRTGTTRNVHERKLPLLLPEARMRS
jgi:hypothetical protein